MSPVILIGGVALLIIVCVAVWNVHSKNTQTADKQLRSWKKADKITALIALYLDIVLKHGPDSQEAEAFKFGIHDQTVLEHDDARHAFVVVAKLVDDALRKFSEHS